MAIPGFHSIGFPSEWGGQSPRRALSRIPIDVSIQLVSPASGEPMTGAISRWGTAGLGFHSIGFPSEWGVQFRLVKGMWTTSFHSIGFPSEWGATGTPEKLHRTLEFPFNWFPQRVGSRQSIQR